MTEPRQLLYALVAGGFLAMVAILVIGAAAVGLAPTWWTIASGTATAISAGVLARWWRRTGMVLALAIGVFLLWTVGTLLII